MNLQPPCPPTREALIEHYAKCMCVSAIAEHRIEFLMELLKELRK
ncbi:MAG: hypothetical protein JWM54_1161 [Acidobacteriaceae bacterium]|nr:hypothetical protein [Acidobacteriaceae bacterium]